MNMVTVRKFPTKSVQNRGQTVFAALSYFPVQHQVSRSNNQ